MSTNFGGSSTTLCPLIFISLVLRRAMVSIRLRKRERPLSSPPDSGRCIKRFQ
eukprot:Gb_13235 [translate_table: standard]